ncbi:MAG TPA: hypothetical protein VGH58_11435 [Solirubrobacterales bacterium]
MKRLLATGISIACVLFAGGADAALVKTGNLVLTADGGFTPRALPRRTFAPIDFDGHADLRAVDGSLPPALQQLELDFDRNGRLSTAGLPICQPALLEEATPAEARSRCREAIVGTGHVGALIALGEGPPIAVSSLLTLFNGPRQEGHPTVILHARTTTPAVQTFVITVPIEERGGLYRYRTIIDIPPIAGGHGSLTHLDVKVGRRYRFQGTERSYTAARCGDGVFRTHGRFTFAEGLIVYGDVEKGCTVR